MTGYEATPEDCRAGLPAVAHLMNLLVDGEYDQVARMSNSACYSARELRVEMGLYPDRLSHCPKTGPPVRTCEGSLDGDPLPLEIHAAFTTQKQEQSDLVLQVRFHRDLSGVLEIGRYRMRPEIRGLLVP